MDDLTLATVIQMPSPWPPATNVLAVEQRGAQSRLHITFTMAGRIRAVVLSHGDQILASTETPPIFITGAGVARAILIVSANAETKSLSIRLNNAEAPSGGSPIELVAGLDPSQLQPSSTTVDDIGIANALKRRAQRVADYQLQGLSAEKIQQRWDDLARECRLLRAAVRRLSEGEQDEVVTVSLHLRKLVGGGKGNHVLQDCAALDDKPIILWIRPPIASKSLDMKGLQFWHKELFSAHPTGFQNHSTDLDVWLSQSAGVVGGRQLSHSDFLHEIADKIGAHLNLRDRTTVEALQSISFTNLPVLAHSLRILGEGVLALGERMLAERDT